MNRWMRWLLVGILGLAGCGTNDALPTQSAATIEALNATIERQQTTIAFVQADNVSLGERVVAVQATATSAAVVPTPRPTATVVVAISTTVALSTTAALSDTSAISSTFDCNTPLGDAINHEDAAGFIGENKTVQGTVVAVGRAKQAVFLNFHDPYQGYFSGVIFVSAWKSFNGKFEDLYANKCVQITGIIEEYKGAPEIIIKSPDQIVVLP